MADYIIKTGDTLAKIAAQHNTSIEELARQNNITNPNLIFEGSTLKVPGEEAADRNQAPDNQEKLEEEIARMQAQIDEMKSYTPEENNELTPWEIVGLGAGGAVAYDAIKHAAPHIAKGVKSAGKSVTKGAKAAEKAVTNGAKAGGKSVTGFAGKVGNGITKGAKGVVNFAKKVGNSIAKGVKTAGNAIGNFGKKVGNNISKGAKVVGNKVVKNNKAGAKILRVGKAGKFLGRAAAPVAAAVSAVEVYDAYKTSGTKAAVKQGTKCASGLACAAAGAKIGAFAGACTGPAAPVAVPVLTAVGSIAGYFGGEKLVDGICKLFKKA